MSVDAQRFMDLVTYIHYLWSNPLQIVLALIFLYSSMGPSIFAGFGVMLLLIPLNMVMAALSRMFQVKLMEKKDSRIKIVNEVLNGIKVWEADRGRETERATILAFVQDFLIGGGNTSICQ